jgi:hypothetical protein
VNESILIVRCDYWQENTSFLIFSSSKILFEDFGDPEFSRPSRVIGGGWGALSVITHASFSWHAKSSGILDDDD